MLTIVLFMCLFTVCAYVYIYPQVYVQAHTYSIVYAEIFVCLNFVVLKFSWDLIFAVEGGPQNLSMTKV